MIVNVQKISEVYLRVESEPSIERELNELFTFDVPNAHFMRGRLQAAYVADAHGNYRPTVRIWDGKKKLYPLNTKLLYAGLQRYLETFCKERGYTLNFADKIQKGPLHDLETIKEFIDRYKVPDTFDKRDYQLKTIRDCIHQRRGLVLSPTSSGKSLLIYILARIYSDLTGKKALIIVPNKGLVKQMVTDLQDYGYKEEIEKITAGHDKVLDQTIVVSTWQSIHRLESKWFNQFGIVIVDEAHGAKADAVTKVLHNMTGVKYRFGFTGTLDGTTTHKLVLEGLFGPVIKHITTSELIEQGYASPCKIEVKVIRYPEAACKIKRDYPEELAYITQCVERNEYIKNLVLKIGGNTIVLFRKIEHGKELHRIISEAKKNVELIYGKTEAEERELIRAKLEVCDNLTVVASFKTFGVGSNTKRLHNIIAASPSKSQIQTLQAIGRSLRLSVDKDIATIYDIADDLSWKTRKNHTLKHLHQRIAMYNQENFPYKIHNVSLS